MKVVLALLSAVGISVACLMISASGADAAACTMVKADPNCWGDTCRMVCAPYGPYRPGHAPTLRADPNCTPCVHGRRSCVYHTAGGRTVLKHRACRVIGRRME